MNFGEAFKNLKEGKKIKRRGFGTHRFLILCEVEGKYHLWLVSVAYSNYNFTMEEIMSSEWVINGNQFNLVTFDEAVQAVLDGSQVSLKDWDDKFLIYDKNGREIILRHRILNDYIFTQEDFMADDFEIYGE